MRAEIVAITQGSKLSGLCKYLDRNVCVCVLGKTTKFSLNIMQAQIFAVF